ncbi:MAG: hypothetical protein OXI07_08995 [Gammaproteobacteria bacterium]|nr:hypothetical protein [Gammaproteobacteria bacterium]
MAVFNELATVLVQGPTEPSLMPLGTEIAPGALLFIFGDGPRTNEPAETVSDLLAWVHSAEDAASDSSWNFVQFPLTYQRLGTTVDFTEEADNLGKGDYVIEVAGVYGPDTSLKLALSLENFATDESFLYADVAAVTATGDGEIAQQTLAGYAANVELVTGGTPATVLPVVATRIRSLIWVRREDITSDFAGLAVTAGGEVEAVAQKTTSLATRYHPMLEDLDTLVEYGRTDAGIPIRWTIETAVRTEDGMSLSLSAAIV